MKKLQQQTSPALRKKIIKKFNELPGSKGKFQIVADEFGLNYFTVWNIVNGRVKKNKSARADKGKSRKNNSEEGSLPGKTFGDFTEPEDLLIDQFMLCLHDLQTTKLTVDLRVSLLEKITRMHKNIEAKQIENFIKRPEALLIVRMMRAVSPDLSEQEIKKIYAQEYEKIMRELS